MARPPAAATERMSLERDMTLSASGESERGAADAASCDRRGRSGRRQQIGDGGSREELGPRRGDRLPAVVYGAGRVVSAHAVSQQTPSWLAAVEDRDDMRERKPGRAV